MPSRAGSLRSALAEPHVAGMLKLLRQAGDEAARAQMWFHRLSAAAIIGTPVATLASGLLLYGAGTEAILGYTR